MSAIFHLCYLVEIFPSLLLDWKSPAFAQTRVVTTDLITPYPSVLTSCLLMQKNLCVPRMLAFSRLQTAENNFNAYFAKFGKKLITFS
jgi:hypothetical protein